MAPGNDAVTKNQAVSTLTDFGLDWAAFGKALQYVREQEGSYTGCLIQMHGTEITIPSQLLRASADISPGVVGTSK